MQIGPMKYDDGIGRMKDARPHFAHTDPFIVCSFLEWRSQPGPSKPPALFAFGDFLADIETEQFEEFMAFQFRVHLPRLISQKIHGLPQLTQVNGLKTLISRYKRYP